MTIQESKPVVFSNINDIYRNNLAGFSEKNQAKIFLMTASSNKELPENMRGSKQQVQTLYDRSVEIYRNLIKDEKPNNLNLLGEAYLLRYQFDKLENYLDLNEAEIILKKAIEKNPITSSSTQDEKNTYFTTNFLLFKAYEKEYEKDDTMEILKVQYDKLCNCLQIDNTVPYIHYSIAKVFYENQKFNNIPEDTLYSCEKALEHINQVKDTDMDKSYYILKANIYIALARLTEDPEKKSNYLSLAANTRKTLTNVVK